MRPFLVIVSSLCVLAAGLGASAAGAPQPPPAPVFVVDGGGWGHGVGMSQWGAYGQALQGRGYEDILGTYYPGATLEQGAPRTVRVLVVQAARSVRISSEAPYRIRDAAGTTVELDPGELTLDAGLEVPVDGVPTPLTAPLTVTSTGGATLGLQGTGYRGKLVVTATAKTVQAINVVALELYLQGVVPGEMPATWPLEALKAQAVAARTYALVSLVKAKPFDLYSDWRSQLYYGTEQESPATTRAVRETKGRILTFDGLPAQTLYFSSSGGRTRSALDVYGNDIPYLVAVDDPWDDVQGNPNHRWQPVTLTGAKLARALKLPGRIVDARTTPGGDGRPASVAFTAATGVVTTIAARDIRQRLSLRSTSFRLGVLRLGATPAATGQGVRLDGVARDVDQPALERRTPDGTWARVRKLAPRRDGTFQLVVRPASATTYRLTGTGVAGPAVTVAGEAPA
jgi:stage II sporulation protein D